MLSKNFKSNKYYEVTRYWLKYGNEEDALENTITVWDSLEKAKAFIEKYRFNRKFYSATVEEIIVDRVISAEDYKKNNYEVVSYQEVYSEDYDGNYDETPGTIYYLNNKKVNDREKQIVETKEKVVGYRVGLGGKIYKTADEAFKNNLKKEKQVFRIVEIDNLTWTYQPIENIERVYKIYFGDDRTFGIQTVGLQSALELGQAYAKEHAGDKIVIIDEDKNIVKEFFEEKKEPVKNSIRTATDFKPRYLSKKEYDDAYQSFSSLVRVGDMVDEQIVEEFRDCLPPVAYNGRYLQCGEAYTHKFNYKTQKYEPAFMTFAKDVGVWVYKGICFYKEYEDVG